MESIEYLNDSSILSYDVCNIYGENMNDFQQYPQVKYSLLFIHGDFGGHWIWTPNFLPFFSKEGYNCKSIELNSSSKGKKDAALIEDLYYYIKIKSEMKNIPVIICFDLGGYYIQNFIRNTKISFPLVVFINSCFPKVPILFDIGTQVYNDCFPRQLSDAPNDIFSTSLEHANKFFLERH